MTLSRILVCLAIMPLGSPARADEENRCHLFCAPELKIEPTITIGNLAARPRIAALSGNEIVSGREDRERDFEIILAFDIPTEIPRVGLTLEAIWKPFAGTDANPFTGRTAEELGEKEIRDNPVELEFELQFSVLEPEQTGGWVEMHFDLVDQFSASERPRDASVYTHKLNLELDTAFLVFNRLPEENYLRNVELELSLDYLASGIPKAGDVLGGERYLDDASPWSLSIVFVFPIAPLLP